MELVRHGNKRREAETWIVNIDQSIRHLESNRRRLQDTLGSWRRHGHLRRVDGIPVY